MLEEDNVIVCEKRTQFGTRILTNHDKVFEHNAWDNVEWDTEQEATAQAKVELNSKHRVSDEKRDEYEKRASYFWDAFYTQHNNRFFKDRHWLFTEFPDLSQLLLCDSDDTNKVKNSMQLKSCSGANELECVCNDNKDSNLVNATEQASKTVTSQALFSNVEEKSEQLCKLVNNHHQDGSRCQDDNHHQDDSHHQVGSNHQDNSLHDDDNHHQDEKTGSLVLWPGQHSSVRLLEVGCGVGNTVFPILQASRNPDLFIYCCDLSPLAIQLVHQHQDYHPSRCHAFVCDVSCENATFPFPEASLDVVMLIFVLSAVPPAKMQPTINRLARLLKPGGILMFRDYGLYDLAQLRFKNGQCIDKNFYARGDGTCVYFFSQDELRLMFTEAGLTEEQNYVDRRLQVNRGKQVKMYRVWLQCKYRKPKAK